MHDALWQVDGHRATIQCDRLKAAIDLARPRLGLHDFRVASQALPSLEILGIDFPACDDAASALPDCDPRAGELLAAYGATPRWPVRVDAFWRVLPPAEHPGAHAAVELIVSVRTDLLDSQPGVSVCGSLEAENVLQLKAGGAFEPVHTATDESAGPGQKPPERGCFLFRLPGGAMSYAEMIHPADYRGTRLQRGQGGPATRVDHFLFVERLEKGVILRARVRGLLAPRDGDADVAAAAYRALAAADPPLGS